ncbi:hypothetical protein ACGFY9_16915 [Streptomyces sp. NPDC048504]|uniref:hypothetical protein n=1 Tax=Streptomyces sp. NPDC048504 TaxID=3365559 RepID=UPI003723C127
MPVTPTAESVRPAPDRSPPAQHPPSAREFRRRHRVPLLATLTALPLYAVWWAFLATGGGDLAAQETWAHFVAHHGGSPYMLSWYGGAHVANYSVLSPYLMAAFGVRTVTVVSGLTATWLTAALMVRAGIRRPLGPALLAALMLWCNVHAGRSTFALGVAFALAACLFLTGPRRPALVAAYTALATLASPVAGLFLAVVGAALLAVRDRGRALSLLVPPAAVVAATTLLFPFSGQQPMTFPRLLPPLLLGLAVTALAPRTWRVARGSGAVYAAVCVLVYLVPSPIGTNVERFAWLFAPPVLLAALMSTPGRARRHRVVLITAVVCSTAWIVPKSVLDLRQSAPVPAWAADTHGVVHALDRLGADRTRVEAVPTVSQREAALLSPHVDLARGWNQQLDMKRHRLFYDGTFSASAYRAWLDHWAVGFVVLPSAEPWHYAEAEAALVRDHRPGWLRPVWHDAHWRVYRVQDAVPLVSPPATVTRTTPAEMDIRMPRPGAVTVRIAYSPWLRSDGACLARDGEFTRLTVSAPGAYRLGSRYWPSSTPDSCC